MTTRTDGGPPVLVTGVAGFIGSHLAAALAADGARVVGIDDFDPFYDRTLKEANLARIDPDRLELVEADIRDGAAMRAAVERHRPHVVYHLAALTGVRPSITAPARYVDVNVGGLTSVLEAARAGGVERIVFASSSSVYGNNRKVPFAEDDPLEGPISPYAATKRAGELLCQTYCHLYAMRIGCARLFTVYGPGQRPDLAISRFMRAMSAGEPITMYGDGDSSRDYTFVDDVVAGLRATAGVLADRPLGFCRIWNLGGARPVTLRELVEAIAGVTGCVPRVDRLPPQPGDVERTFADLSRSRAELGYAPATALEEGLARQWAWMRERDQGSGFGVQEERAAAPSEPVTIVAAPHGCVPVADPKP
jgi:UDP-glucuronate 4-epimerase